MKQNNPKTEETTQELTLAERVAQARARAKKGEAPPVVESTLTVETAKELTAAVTEKAIRVGIVRTLNRSRGATIIPCVTKSLEYRITHFTSTHRETLGENIQGCLAVFMGWDCETDPEGNALLDEKGELKLITKDENGKDLPAKDLMAFSITYGTNYNSPSFKRSKKDELCFNSNKDVPMVTTPAQEGKKSYSNIDWNTVGTGAEKDLEVAILAGLATGDPEFVEFAKSIPISDSAPSRKGTADANADMKSLVNTEEGKAKLNAAIDNMANNALGDD